MLWTRGRTGFPGDTAIALPEHPPTHEVNMTTTTLIQLQDVANESLSWTEKDLVDNGNVMNQFMFFTEGQLQGGLAVWFKGNDHKRNVTKLAVRLCAALAADAAILILDVVIAPSDAGAPSANPEAREAIGVELIGDGEIFSCFLPYNRNDDESVWLPEERIDLPHDDEYDGTIAFQIASAIREKRCAFDEQEVERCRQEASKLHAAWGVPRPQFT
jgi:hypothetical protein